MSDAQNRLTAYAAEYADTVWPDLDTPMLAGEALERAEVRADAYANAHVEGEHAAHGCPFATSTECGERAAAAEFVEST